MLSPRLTNCPECANIPSLLKKIDCKLAELGNSLYNNVSYMLNQPIPAGSMLQLIAYRRILTHKYCNPNYLHEYSVAMIASRVIRITVGCVSRCNEPEPCIEVPCDITIVPNPSTTTTSSSSTSTTTTTTVEPTTSTTTSSSSTSSTTSTSTTAVPTTTTTSSSTSTTTSSSTSTTTSTSSTSSSTTTTTSTTAYVLQCTGGYSGPVGFPNIKTGNGTMILGSGLVISTTYVGPALLTGIQPPFTNCVGGQFSGDVGIGGTIPLNYNSGAFTFTITYSAPQTAVKFVLAGIGYVDQLGISEYYTITTDSTNTLVNVIAGCGDFRVEAPNVVAGSMQNPLDIIGGNIEVIADTSFTTITITGNNSASLAGTSFDMNICNSESTTSTTTTLAPSEFNTIYTHFDPL